MYKYCNAKSTSTYDSCLYCGIMGDRCYSKTDIKEDWDCCDGGANYPVCDAGWTSIKIWTVKEQDWCGWPWKTKCDDGRVKCEKAYYCTYQNECPCGGLSKCPCYETSCGN
jgi:hypothetical protein